MNSILVFFHCPTNAGYAITRLESTFLAAARRVAGGDEAVHFAYPDLSPGHPRSLPPGFNQVIRFDPRTNDPVHRQLIEQYVRQHDIRIAFGFDQPVRRPGYSALRRGGVRTFISYWGAPMSGLNRGLALAIKRIDVALARNGPDHYVFESLAMQRTAVEGRGIPRGATSVTYLGVDPEQFRPPDGPDWYAHNVFAIPRDRHIVYFSGHMEERKGVHVLVKAIVELVARGVRNVHLLVVGNREGEATAFDRLFRGTPAESYITFGGYRDDVRRILPSVFAGAIASTGWDSFTLSSVEMAACGIPLVVSSLPGLDETVEDGTTGFLFPVGDANALADRLSRLISDAGLRQRMSQASRRRAVERFTAERQVSSLASTINAVDAAHAGGSGR